MTQVSKTFRSSPAAVDVLQQQGNQSQFVEELITGTPTRALEVVPLQQLKHFLEKNKTSDTPKTITSIDATTGTAVAVEKPNTGPAYGFEVVEIPGVNTADKLEGVKYEKFDQ